MEDRLADIDLAEVILLTNTKEIPPESATTRKSASFYVGEHIHLAVKIPLTALALQQLKSLRGTQTPTLTSNKIRNLLRELTSTVHAHVELKAIVNTNCKPSDKVPVQWKNCPVYASCHETLTQKTNQVKDTVSIQNNSYVIPLQSQLSDLPDQCNKVELIVTVKPVYKTLPSWLSSPTIPDFPNFSSSDTQVQENESNSRWKIVSQTLRVIHPPSVYFQQRTVSDKHIIMIQVHNRSQNHLKITDCSIMPESCPKKQGKSTCSTAFKGEGPQTVNTCVIHSNMVKLVTSDTPTLQADMLPGETLSLLYQLHLHNSMEPSSREEFCLVAHMKWEMSKKKEHSCVQTTYRLPTLKLKQAQFVMSAICSNEGVTVGEVFTVTYNIKNRLQDFISIKLYWNPVPQDDSEEELQAFEDLKAGVICHDPCVQFGDSSLGSTGQVQVTFRALRPGLYEVGKHMKINLRYVIPNSETSSLSSLSPSSRTATSLLSGGSGEEQLVMASEELWRDRSGSGSSLTDSQLLSASDRRLSFANKSYSFGDLGPNASSESDSGTKKKYKNIERSPSVLPGNIDRHPQHAKQLSKFEKLLMSPGNFMKNSCKVYVVKEPPI